MRIRVRKIGRGTPEDPYRPRLITRDGKELGKDIQGITWCTVEITDTEYVIEVSIEDHKRLKTLGVLE